MTASNLRQFLLGLIASALAATPTFAPARAQQQQRPNIVIIWGDDIGKSDISAYSHGLMGFKTPNIDRIATEGVMFTDYYAEQSCTAGRASFITGQSGLRTGMTKVGLPGATLGLQKEDPTIAELLKPLGYATGQFGKNHLGDRIGRGRGGAQRCRCAPMSARTCWSLSVERPAIAQDGASSPR